MNNSLTSARVSFFFSRCSTRAMPKKEAVIGTAAKHCKALTYAQALPFPPSSRSTSSLLDICVDEVCPVNVFFSEQGIFVIHSFKKKLTSMAVGTLSRNMKSAANENGIESDIERDAESESVKRAAINHIRSEKRVPLRRTSESFILIF